MESEEPRADLLFLGGTTMSNEFGNVATVRFLGHHGLRVSTSTTSASKDRSLVIVIETTINTTSSLL